MGGNDAKTKLAGGDLPLLVDFLEFLWNVFAPPLKLGRRSLLGEDAFDQTAI